MPCPAYLFLQVSSGAGRAVANPDLDKDWAAIPEYISSGCMCALVFIMGITMKGLSFILSENQFHLYKY